MCIRDSIEGKIRSRSYDDQNGIKRYVYEIFADNMEMLTPRSAQPVTQAQPTASVQQQPAAQPTTTQETAINNDLPF